MNRKAKARLFKAVVLLAGILLTSHFAFGQMDLTIIGETNVCPDETYSYYVNTEGQPGQTMCPGGYFDWIVSGGHFADYDRDTDIRR